MIIVEGPDGSGKSNLVRRINEEFGLPIHERASTSVGGPVEDLMGWAYRDVTTMPEQPLSVYDRHPLISEYIYAPLVRILRHEFVTPSAHTLIRLMARQTFVVWCVPPYTYVSGNVSDDLDNQMQGVHENLGAIYELYNAMRMFWSGQSMVWDYTKSGADPTNISNLQARLRNQIGAMNMQRNGTNV